MTTTLAPATKDLANNFIRLVGRCKDERPDSVADLISEYNGNTLLTIDGLRLGYWDQDNKFHEFTLIPIPEDEYWERFSKKIQEKMATIYECVLD